MASSRRVSPHQSPWARQLGNAFSSFSPFSLWMSSDFQVATWHPVWKSHWYVVVSLHFVWTKFYIHPCALDSSCFQHWTSSMGPNSSYFIPVFSKHKESSKKTNSQKNAVFFLNVSVNFRKFPEAFDALQCLEHPSTASVPHRWVLELHSWTSHRLAS